MLMFFGVVHLCANAQSVEATQPSIPESSVAAESGPGTLWVNPASLGFDAKPWYGAYLSMPPQNETYSVAAAAGSGGFGLGLHHTHRPTGASWSLASASSFDL